MNKETCPNCNREAEVVKNSTGEYIFCSYCDKHYPKEEPVIYNLINKFKSRKLRKKQEEIELLKLDIEKAKLQKELEEIYLEYEDNSI